MPVIASLIAISGSLGYALPALVGLESMGVPSPGETALLAAAVLASKGKLDIVLVIAIATASAMLGDNIGYALGRRLGREVLEAPGPFRHHRQRAIAAGDRFFAKHGTKAVFLGRWVTLARIAVAWLAGINEMRFRVFFFWNATGALTWATAVGLLGYFGGDAVEKVLKDVGTGGAVVVVAGVVIAFVVLRIRERRKGDQASADAPPAAEAGASADAGAPASKPSANELMQ